MLIIPYNEANEAFEEGARNVFFFWLSAAAILVAFIIAGQIIGRRTEGAKDYAFAGGKASGAGVAGILLGSVVGGASTVGTVQMGYLYGFSAMWFTVGGGVACFLLGRFLARPVRTSGVATVTQLLKKEFGETASTVAMLGVTLGSMLSMITQFMSCNALIQGVAPVSRWGASAITTAAMFGFIAFGGMKSFAQLGKAKILLLYIAMGLCTLAAIQGGGTAANVGGTLPLHPWFNPFGRGFFEDLGGFFSLLTGILCTQIYTQALISGRSLEAAKRGAYISAALMPPLGFFGIWVGLTLRAQGVDIPAGHALGWFIRNHFPPAAAGAIWVAILITAIGCAAGLVLGIGTNFIQDYYPCVMRACRPSVTEDSLQRGTLAASRTAVIVLIVTAATFGALGENLPILQWSYLGLAFRGAGTLCPFMVAVLLPGRLKNPWALAAIAGGTAIVCLWPLLKLPGNPLYPGFAFSALCCLVGCRKTA